MLVAANNAVPMIHAIVWDVMAILILKYGQVFQQRNDADNDDNDLRDLPRAAIERQTLDEIEHQDDHQKVIRMPISTDEAMSLTPSGYV
ncbi:hypothetical protein NKJ18_29020 [Mesorhizobium sp. M0217]